MMSTENLRLVYHPRGPKTSVYDLLKHRDVSDEFDDKKYNTRATDDDSWYRYNPFIYMCGDGGWVKDGPRFYNDCKVCLSDQKEEYLLKEQFDLNVDFSNIKTNVKVIWYQPGTNDEESWYFIGQMTTSDNQVLYFFMDAWCDYTGFDCQGQINFSLSRTLDNLCTYGITDGLRMNCINSV
jgi:hypothetical protein